MQWLQDPNHRNVDNLNDVRREDSKLRYNKKIQYLKAKIDELETNSKIKNIRGFYRVISDFNLLRPNYPYRGRTAPLTSKDKILYIYSTNIDNEYFKHCIYSSFFPLSKCSLFHNSKVFGSCIIHILYTGCAKIKNNNSGAKSLKKVTRLLLKQ